MAFILKEKELSPGINLSDVEQIASVDGERLARTRKKTWRPTV
jgi:hypothetical protein